MVELVDVARGYESYMKRSSAWTRSRRSINESGVG